MVKLQDVYKSGEQRKKIGKCHSIALLAGSRDRLLVFMIAGVFSSCFEIDLGG